MVTLQAVLVDALWVVGLAGILGTTSYIRWYRGNAGWSWVDAWRTPRMKVPLFLSLTFYCMGVALTRILHWERATWWEGVAWSLLAILFLAQVIRYRLVGERKGWDTPTEGTRDNDRAEKIER